MDSSQCKALSKHFKFFLLVEEQNFGSLEELEMI